MAEASPVDTTQARLAGQMKMKPQPQTRLRTALVAEDDAEALTEDTLQAGPVAADEDEASTADTP